MENKYTREKRLKGLGAIKKVLDSQKIMFSASCSWPRKGSLSFTFPETSILLKRPEAHSDPFLGYVLITEIQPFPTREGATNHGLEVGFKQVYHLDHKFRFLPFLFGMKDYEDYSFENVSNSKDYHSENHPFLRDKFGNLVRYDDVTNLEYYHSKRYPLHWNETGWVVSYEEVQSIIDGAKNIR